MVWILRIVLIGLHFPRAGAVAQHGNMSARGVHGGQRIVIDIDPYGISRYLLVWAARVMVMLVCVRCIWWTGITTRRRRGRMRHSKRMPPSRSSCAGTGGAFRVCAVSAFAFVVLVSIFATSDRTGVGSDGRHGIDCNHLHVHYGGMTSTLDQLGGGTWRTVQGGSGPLVQMHRPDDAVLADRGCWGRNRLAVAAPPTPLARALGFGSSTRRSQMLPGTTSSWTWNRSCLSQSALMVLDFRHLQIPPRAALCGPRNRSRQYRGGIRAVGNVDVAALLDGCDRSTGIGRAEPRGGSDDGTERFGGSDASISNRRSMNTGVAASLGPPPGHDSLPDSLLHLLGCGLLAGWAPSVASGGPRIHCNKPGDGVHVHNSLIFRGCQVENGTYTEPGDEVGLCK